MIKPFAISLLVILAIFMLLKWSNNHTEKLNTAMQAYEQCVQDEYGTTPSHWYAENGELPPCQR